MTVREQIKGLVGKLLKVLPELIKHGKEFKIIIHGKHSKTKLYLITEVKEL